MKQRLSLDAIPFGSKIGSGNGNLSTPGGRTFSLRIAVATEHYACDSILVESSATLDNEAISAKIEAPTS